MKRHEKMWREFCGSLRVHNRWTASFAALRHLVLTALPTIFRAALFNLSHPHPHPRTPTHTHPHAHAHTHAHTHTHTHTHTRTHTHRRTARSHSYRHTLFLLAGLRAPSSSLVLSSLPPPSPRLLPGIPYLIAEGRALRGAERTHDVVAVRVEPHSLAGHVPTELCGWRPITSTKLDDGRYGGAAARRRREQHPAATKSARDRQADRQTDGRTKRARDAWREREREERDARGADKHRPGVKVVASAANTTERTSSDGVHALLLTREARRVSLRSAHRRGA